MALRYPARFSTAMPKLFYPCLMKAEGTCKPGERADLTGCTPASGSSSGPDPAPDSAPTFARFRGALKLTAKSNAAKVAARINDNSREGMQAAIDVLGKQSPAVLRIPILARRMGQAVSRSISSAAQDAVAWAENDWGDDPARTRREALERVVPTRIDMDRAFDDTFGDWLESGNRGPKAMQMLEAMERVFLGKVRTPEERNYKSMMAWQTKAEGTCKPGERSDLTGCTPASDDSSKGPKQKKPDTPNPIHSISASIDENPELSEHQKQAYKTALSHATAKMPAKAMQLIAKGMERTSFYPDRKSLAEGITKSSLAGVDRSNYSADVLKEAHAQLAKESVQKRVAGAYTRNDSVVHLDGEANEDSDNVRMDGRSQTLAGVYTHELAHAMDGPNFELSNSQEFERAWLLEIWSAGDEAKLTKYAKTNQQEGFAEFSRMIYATDTDPKEVARRFPATSKFFKAQGLWPGARK